MKTFKMKANSIILALLIAFSCIGYIQPIKTYALTSQQNELIEKVGTYAREHYDEYKILPSFVVAQALQESAVAVSYHSSGLSSLARVYNNYFGMKCGDGYTGASVNLSTGEQTPAGSTYYVSSNFRVFSSFEKGMKGYYDFIYGYSRYHNIIGVTDYKTVCKLIKQDGWATDISYTEGLISKIETFNLTRFDKDLFNKQSFTPSKKSITINASDSEKQTVRFTARNYDKGDMYAMAAPLFVVEEIRPVKLMVNASEKLFTSIKKGMPVDVKLDVYGDEVFKGVVSLVYPTINPQSRTFPVEIKIQNGNEKIRPGMFARVTFAYGTAEHVVVPDMAVVKLSGSGDRFVYVVEDGKVVFKKVELGRRFDTEYEIVSGLSSGDKVVVEGHSRLVNGAAVDVIE